MASEPGIPQPYGFWIRVRDRESATYAARMSGLPVLLVGILQAFAGLFDATMSSEEKIARFIIAGLFIIAGIAIRRGVFMLIPIVCTIMLLMVIAGLAGVAMEIFSHLRQGVPGQYLTASFTWQSIMPILILLLMISGFRGWWWLHRNRKAEDSR